MIPSTNLCLLTSPLPLTLVIHSTNTLKQTPNIISSLTDPDHYLLTYSLDELVLEKAVYKRIRDPYGM